jgi:hypothetical protein
MNDCSPSDEQVQLENLARSLVRYPFWLASPFVECRANTDAISGAAPLGASLIRDTHTKLRSVGANTAVLQGQPTAIFVLPSSGSPPCPI